MEWQNEVEDDELRASTRKYLPQTVIWTTDWTTGALTEQMRRGVFDVDPPFQRRSAWDDKKASLYIESLLLGCPVPAITLAEVTDAKPPRQYIVIDGKQRLGSIKQFAVDETLRLSSLQTLTELNGLQFREVAALPEFSRFENLPIRTVVMRNWQKSEVLQFVFHRLNSQVTPLSTHELRRALLAGGFTSYLDEASARSVGIQSILGITEPDYRLRDAELLLRAIAFSEFIRKYRGNLKEFLDSSTRTLNRHWSARMKRSLDSLCSEVDKAIQTTYEIFGEAAFQRYDQGTPVGRFNRAVFDMMILTFRFNDVRLKSIARADAVRNRFVELMNDAEFSRWTEATTKSKDAVEGRLDRWGAALGVVVGLPGLSERVMLPSIPDL